VRSTFRDPSLQADLERDGFAVLPFLDADEVAHLRRTFEELGRAPGDPEMACHSSFHSYDRDYKVAVDRAVREVFDPHLEEHFDRQRALPCNFIAKWPGGMGGFGLHQDLSLVDERRHRSVEVWVALDDVGGDNGVLWMVPGSHQWLPANVRGIHAFGFPYVEVARRIIDRHAVPVPVPAGHAVVFAHATLHFSPPNRSDRPRLVAITDLIPQEAEHLHYFGDGHGGVEAYVIGDHFWTDNSPFTLVRPPAETGGVHPVDHGSYPPVTDEDLDRWVAEGRAIESGAGPKGALNPGRAWCHRCGRTDLDVPAPNRWIGNVTLLCPDCRIAEAGRAGSAARVGLEGGLAATAELTERGWVTVPLLGADQLRALEAVFAEAGVDESLDFTATCNDPPRPVARHVDLALKELVAPMVADLLADHEPFLAAFVTKGGATSAAMALHQDLTYVDEREHRSVMVWIPLVDVDERSGALTVVDGSHRWSDHLRAGGHGPLATVPLQEALAPLAHAVPMRAGEAIVFDHALIHGSAPNDAPRTRAAVAVAFAPTAARLVHFHRDDEGPVAGFEIDESFFCTNEFRARPAGPPTVEPWAPVLEAADLQAALVGRGIAPVPVRPAATPVAGPRDLLPAPPGGVLRDPELDDALARDGFTTFPLLDPATTAALRDRYRELHPATGSTFEPDLENPDVEYRRQVSLLLGEALDDRVRERFVDHVPFLRNYLCKWPGPDSGLYLHRDWTYVDEREGHRTFVVWIALTDVLGHNGQLRVLPRSHRLDAMVRGTDLGPAWLAHQELIDEHLVSVPVPEGHAVVMDNGVLHSSYPNHTDEPRLVAAVGMRPRSAGLVYWRRLDATTALRYDVDDEFFLTETPSGLAARPPARPVREAVTVGDAALDAATLRALVDRSVRAELSRRLRRWRATASA